MKPRAPVLHYFLARSLWKLARFDEADAAYRRALRHDPRYIDAHRELTELLLQLLRWDEAQEAARSLIAYLHCLLIAVQLAAERADDALRSATRARDIDPDEPHPHMAIGSACAAMERREEALAP